MADDDSSSPENPRPETVEALLEEAKFHAQFEEARLGANNQRAAWLLALDGIILGLAATQGREMLAKASQLGSAGRWIAALSLAIGVLAVLVSAGCAMRVIYRVWSWGWGRDDVRSLNREETLAEPRDEVQGTFLNGLVERICVEQESYAKRAPWLDTAFKALGVALVAITIHVGVYTVRTVENPRICPAVAAKRAEEATPRRSLSPPEPGVAADLVSSSIEATYKIPGEPCTR